MAKELLAIAGMTLGLANIMAGRDRAPGGPSWERLEGLSDDTLVHVYGYSVKLGDLRRVMDGTDLRTRAEELRRQVQEDPGLLDRLRRELEGGKDDDETYGSAIAPSAWFHHPSKLTWESVLGGAGTSRLLKPTSMFYNRPRWMRVDPLSEELLGPPSSRSLEVQQKSMLRVQDDLTAITVSPGTELTRRNVSKNMSRVLYGLSALMLELYGAPLFDALQMDQPRVGTLTREVAEEIVSGQTIVGVTAGTFDPDAVGGCYSPDSGELLLPDSPHGAVSYLHELWHGVDHVIGQRMIWQAIPDLRHDAPVGIDLSAVMSSLIRVTPIGVVSEMLMGFWSQHLRKAHFFAILNGDFEQAAMIDGAGAYICSPEETWARFGHQMSLVLAKRAGLPFFTARNIDFIPSDQVPFTIPIFVGTLLLSSFGHGHRDIRPSMEARQMRMAVQGMHPTVRRIGQRLLPHLRDSYGRQLDDRIELIVEDAKRHWPQMAHVQALRRAELAERGR